MKPKQRKKLLQQVGKEPQVKIFTEQEVAEFANSVILGYLASSIVALRDTFGFGKDRIERFLHAESNHAQAIKQNYVTPSEILEQIKSETGFDLNEFIAEKSEEITNGKSHRSSNNG